MVVQQIFLPLPVPVFLAPVLQLSLEKNLNGFGGWTPCGVLTTSPADPFTLESTVCLLIAVPSDNGGRVKD